ncbi:hypothetical protein HDV04_003669 [Boothiomyces sp. JEL0838]|nr:hypothetical protein HDV04_003669 [Boothiomyces sp. JEL0838]
MKPRETVAVVTLDEVLKLDHKPVPLEIADDRSRITTRRFNEKQRAASLPHLKNELADTNPSVKKTVKLKEQLGSKSIQDKFDYIALLAERFVHNAQCSSKGELLAAHKKFLHSLSQYESKKKAKVLNTQLSNRSLQSRNSESAYTENSYQNYSIAKKKRRDRESEGEALLSRLYFSLNQKHPSEAHKFLIDHDRKLRSMRKLQTADQIFQIMHSCSRSSSDLVAVDDYLRNLPAFSNLPDYILLDLWKLMVAEKFEKGQVLFRQGDPGIKWYVILHGSVKLYVNKGIAMDGKPITNYLATMNAGEKFGDQALFNDLPRSATAIADSNPTFVLTLEKTHFLKLMAKVHIYHQKSLISSLKKFRFLSNLDLPSLKLIAERMATRTILAETVIVKQGSFIDTVFFILSGKCAVFRKVKILTETGKKVTKHVYMGSYGPNSTFNEQAALTDRKLPSPYTVIAKEPTEIVGIVTNGEWLNLRLNFESSTFATMSDEEIIYKYNIRTQTESFRKYQHRFITDLHKSNGSIKLAVNPNKI